MKTFYRMLSVLLVLLTVFTLTACTKPKTTTEQPEESTAPSTSAPTSEEVTDQPPFTVEDGFGGESIRFFVNEGQDGVATRSIALSEDDDPTYEVNVMTVERNTLVEEALDVKIEIAATCGMQEADDVLKPILQSHMYTFDVVCLYQYFDLGMALGDTVGCFYNYSNMPEDVTNYINLEADYWS